MILAWYSFETPWHMKFTILQNAQAELRGTSVCRVHTIVLNDLVVCCLHIMDIVLVAGWLGRFDGSIYKLVVFDSVLDPI